MTIGTLDLKKSYHHSGPSPRRPNELWTRPDDGAARAQAPGCQHSSCGSVRRGRGGDQYSQRRGERQSGGSGAAARHSQSAKVHANFHFYGCFFPRLFLSFFKTGREILLMLTWRVRIRTTQVI